MPGRFCIGDKVYCKIRGNSIISAQASPHDVQLIFEVIGRDEMSNKYIILVPKYLSIKNSWNVVEEHIHKLNINSRYLDNKAISITEDKILKVAASRLDGMFCSNCEEFFPMAEPNQPDGTLKCYSCRSNPWR